MFVPGGTADKKLEGIHKNCFFFYFLQMCFSLLFIWARHSMEEGGGGMGDNSNSTAKFKIQFRNSSPAF